VSVEFRVPVTDKHFRLQICRQPCNRIADFEKPGTVSPRKFERLEKILQVSAQLFARQGYHGTSTREIARIADLSENTLFRYFEHKEDIFWAALRHRLGGFQPKRELLEGLVQCENPETLLPKIVAQLVDSAVLHPEVLRLVVVAFLELRWKAATVCGEFLSPIFSTVTAYLKANIERGRLRNLDPTLITAAIVTTVLAHPEIVRIMEKAEPAFADNRAAIQVFSSFWLEVLTPSRPETLRVEVKPS
jgi:AcrR family transcriptional regulator